MNRVTIWISLFIVIFTRSCNGRFTSGERLVLRSLDYFLPLASAMAAVVFSLIISFKVSAQKISIPASILLVLAVLQDRWHSALPPGPKYFAYMDVLLMFAYLVTVVVVLHSGYCVNRC